MKKLKKILFLIIISIVVFTIYVLNHDQKLNYLALGDSIASGQNPYGEKKGYGYPDYIASYLKEKKALKSYSKGFTTSGYRTTNVLNDLANNKHIIEDNKEKNIRKTLREADIITISIGANDFLNNIDIKNISSLKLNEEQLKSYIDKIVPSLKEVFKELRKYTKSKIIVVSYYNPMPVLLKDYEKEIDNILNYTDIIYNDLCKTYNMTYINVKEAFFNNKEYLPNPLDIHPNTKGYEQIAKQIIEYLDKEVL